MKELVPKHTFNRESINCYTGVVSLSTLHLILKVKRGKLLGKTGFHIKFG